MKKDLFFHEFFLITLINFDTQVLDVQTSYSVLDFGLNQPLGEEA